MIDGKTTFEKPLTNIYDADVSNDGSISFIVFSNSSRSIHLIQRDLALISFKWSSNFWIYIIMFIHLAALLLGFLHFTLILHNTQRAKMTLGGSSHSQPNLVSLSQSLLMSIVGDGLDQ